MNAVAASSPAPLVGDCPVRDESLRAHYARRALAEIPRLLGAVDRNRYRATCGCFDREFWHYRTSSFPSEMYQEGVLPLALVWATPLPGNRWHHHERVRELAAAALRFSAQSAHRDGSCDDYYPFERALGAAVFSLQAAAEAYRLLELDDQELLGFLVRRATWVAEHGESGRLANHEALAALALARVAAITGREAFGQAAHQRITKLLSWQSDEGWFEEYGGADPGYQTVSIDALAKYRLLTGDRRLDEPLRRAVGFARWFLHPDDSYGGPYGSRGTRHFYPHGMELLAAELSEAAELADGFLRSLAAGTEACFGDDRMYVHRLGNLIEAYRDWSAVRAGATAGLTSSAENAIGETARGTREVRYFPQARILVVARQVEADGCHGHACVATSRGDEGNAHAHDKRGHGTPDSYQDGLRHTVISAARGGAFVHFAGGEPTAVEAGLVLQMSDGRVAVSTRHDLGRTVHCSLKTPSEFAGPVEAVLSIDGPMHWVCFETATPGKQAVLHLGMVTVGRGCRGWVRRLLQRRLITGRRPCPIRLSRRFELRTLADGAAGPSLRVTDTIELADRRLSVARMHYAPEQEPAYVAASGVYQPGVLAAWTDLAEWLDLLNRDRRVSIVREF